MDMHDVIICTTAVDRPELHKNIFPKYLKFLDGVDFHWLIHINNVWDEVSNTVDGLKEILPQDSSYEFILSEEGGTEIDFFNAAKKLIEDCTNYKSKYGVLWLEDDWDYFGDDKLIDIVGDYTYLQLVKRGKGPHMNDEISFNPSVFSWDAVKTIMQPNMKRTEHYYYNKNPERCALFDDDAMMSIVVDNHVVKPNFKDFGRRWMKDNHSGQRVFRVNQ